MEQALFWPGVVLAGVLGSVVGRLLNVSIDAIFTKAHFTTLQLFCSTCNRKLKWKGLVPIVGYLQIFGRCPLCGTLMPLRILLLEILSMVVFVYVAINHRATLLPEGVVLLLYIELLLAIAIIDLERRLVLDKLLYVAVPVSLFLAPWGPPGVALSAKNAYISALQGGILAFLFFAVIFFIVKNRLGAGDVKLSLLLGLIMGLPLAIIGFQIGIAAGGFVALASVTLKQKKLNGELPFAPFLAGGTIVVLLWGQNLLRWYEGLVN